MQHDTDSIHAPPEGVFSSIKNFGASFVSHLHSRLQLFATEFAEEKHRQTSLLFSAISALFFLFVAIVLAALFVIVVAWDTPYRLHAVGGLALMFLMGAGIFWGIVRAKLKSKPRLFQASLAELYKDWQQLSSE
ncbi:MAG: phage holin family protein [Sulfuricaulis sp.]|nr:phage holin family protein [Sulfuricaulis sp.]